jgi:hypothetical protein
MAGQFDSTFHQANLSRILSRAFRLAEFAGEEQDAVPARDADPQGNAVLAGSSALAAMAR